MGLFNSKHQSENSSQEDIKENENKYLSDEDNIKKFHEIIRRNMICQNNIENFDNFVVYILDIIENVKSRNLWYGKHKLITKYDMRLLEQNLEHNKMISDKLKLELEIKKYEINKLKKKITNKEYKEKASLKRKEITNINQEIKKIPKKKRKLTIEHRKNMDNFQYLFLEKYPEYDRIEK